MLWNTAEQIRIPLMTSELWKLDIPKHLLGCFEAGTSVYCWFLYATCSGVGILIHQPHQCTNEPAQSTKRMLRIMSWFTVCNTIHPNKLKDICQSGLSTQYYESVAVSWVVQFSTWRRMSFAAWMLWSLTKSLIAMSRPFSCSQCKSHESVINRTGGDGPAWPMNGQVD